MAMHPWLSNTRCNSWVPKIESLPFEIIFVKSPDGSFADFTKDVQYLGDNDFTFNQKKISEFVEQSIQYY